MPRTCFFGMSHVTNSSSQEHILYVFDPTALHSIIIKDQQYYEEASFSVSLVSRSRN